MQDILVWLQPFTVNLEDLEMYALAHSSERENSDSEGDASKVETQKRKHSVHGLLPQKPKEIYSASRKVWWLDNSRVLNEGRESRNNHRYAVVEQVLATPWNPSSPCKSETSHETERSLWKFLEPSHRPKVVKTDNSMAFGKECEDLSWKHRTSTPHRLERNGIAERAVRRVEECTSALLLQTRIEWKVVVWPYGTLLPFAKCQRPPGRSENSVWKTIWRTIPRPMIKFGATIIRFTERTSKNSSICQEHVIRNLSCLWVSRGRKFEKEIFR